MPTNTYVALSTQTVAVATPSVTFTSIPQGYTDLVVIAQPKNTTQAAAFTPSLFFNTDTGTSSTNYSNTWMYGNGSSAASFRWTSSTPARGVPFGGGSTNFNNIGTVNIMNYSNSTTFKTAITRYQEDSAVYAVVSLWRNTSPITSVTLYPGDAGSNTFAVGSTFTIYGIAAASVGAKATGGTIYQDADYFYHAFAGNGTFTPTQSLSADVLVVAGGGSGGRQNAGGGGAGGLLMFSSQSLTATGYTVTVGAGGVGGSSNTQPGGNGGNSQFGALTTAVGGGYGGNFWGGGYNQPANGGSGGGAAGGMGSASQIISSGTSGQGNAGGNGSFSGSGNGGGGGGGAGAVGGNAANGVDIGAPGGIGATSSFINAMGAATGAGQTVSGTTYFAGGGGGGGSGGDSVQGAGGLGGGGMSKDATAAVSGTANTGGGGGAARGTLAAGNGGSGIVIVRYAK